MSQKDQESLELLTFYSVSPQHSFYRFKSWFENEAVSLQVYADISAGEDLYSLDFMLLDDEIPASDPMRKQVVSELITSFPKWEEVNYIRFEDV